MKSKLALIVAVAFALGAGVAKADIVIFSVPTSFASTGDLACQSCSLSGTITINNATGAMLGANLSFSGAGFTNHALTFTEGFGTGVPGTSALEIADAALDSGSIHIAAFLYFPVQNFVGYLGGPLCTPANACAGSLSSNVHDFDPATYQLASGSLVPLAVPGPIAGAGLPGLLAGVGAMLAWYRKRSTVAG